LAGTQLHSQSNKKGKHMPSTLTYPGVYIEEIPSGVHAITGVATSITAFVGRALRGPTDADEDSPFTTINNYGAFERTFGGLWLGSGLGFAVRDFFLNGGSQAIIVRCYRPDGVAADRATMSINGLDLEAASPGAWGNQLRVRIDHDTRPLLPTEAANSLFNLSVKDVGVGTIEIFRNVSITTGHPRRVDTVLRNESQLLRATTVPNALPNPHAAIGAGENPDPFSDDFPARCRCDAMKFPIRRWKRTSAGCMRCSTPIFSTSFAFRRINSVPIPIPRLLLM
jgi:hypothetical protein